MDENKNPELEWLNVLVLNMFLVLSIEVKQLYSSCGSECGPLWLSIVLESPWAGLCFSPGEFLIGDEGVSSYGLVRISEQLFFFCLDKDQFSSLASHERWIYKLPARTPEPTPSIKPPAQFHLFFFPSSFSVARLLWWFPMQL